MIIYLQEKLKLQKYHSYEWQSNWSQRESKQIEMVMELSIAVLLEVDRGSSQLWPERWTDSIALLKLMVLTSKSECCWLLTCINPTEVQGAA